MSALARQGAQARRIKNQGDVIWSGHGIARLWPAQRRARYESIHKAVQYNNSGAIQTATNINESDGFTMGPRKEGFPLFI
jgi:hypothetical protein